MDLSLSEIVVIVVVIIVVFGPKKIPEIARGLGQGMRSLKQATEEIKQEIFREASEINPEKQVNEEISNITKTIHETKESIEDAVGPIKRK